MGVMKAAKPMKAMKAMKAMKKISAGLSRRHVFAGKAAKSIGGLTKDKLVKDKSGKIVSKVKSAKGKKSPWIAACIASRKVHLCTSRPRLSTRSDVQLSMVCTREFRDR